MKNQSKEVTNWASQLQNHRQNCRMLQQRVEEVKTQYTAGANVLPLLRKLKDSLRGIVSESDWLQETLCAGPARKLFSKDRNKLTIQQYWLLRARGVQVPTVKSLGICGVDDYDVYEMCIYEGNDVICLMDPNETPEVTTVDNKTGIRHTRLRLSSSPEELKLRHLRPEQREFFAKYSTDVLARMQPDCAAESCTG